MSTPTVTRAELKHTIRTLLEREPDTFFSVLREVRDEMHADGTIAASDEPTDGEKLRAEVEADLGILADFFRGFA
ncbi:hypothetical protein LEM8419_02048 [Neolewinella maritima]|uniref:Uncharacterized protein n=1 Tax=Neolewinella maritima TaxID=1383882 RepID=A0ABM9B1Y9_9BACT|nr:hypothetical protein [Neolewinella maritima]CAH1001114.1 hypothetical protein LEM8419_02048 [Neolewinella maritima]